MAFDPLESSDLESGDPVSQEVLDQVRTNLDDLDSRTTTLETSLQSFLPITFVLFGGHWKGGVTGLAFWRVPFAITLTDSRLYLPEDGASGTCTVDVKKSAAGGASFSTIFSSAPSLAAGSAHQVDQGTISVTSLIAGDILRLDLTQAQVGQKTIHLYLHFEAA